MHLLIPAAGVGRRMGSDRNKLLLRLKNEPLLAWTLQAAEASQQMTWIGIICQSVDEPDIKTILQDLALTTPIQLIQGGSTRQESVYNGLQALPTDADQVLIHDGARCLATPTLFDRCAEALQSCLGFVAAVPVKDTIKVVDDTATVQNTPDRSTLWAAQTPQGFQVEQLKAAHAQGIASGWTVTDDAALFERCGLPVKIVLGEETNFKVTTPEDLKIAEMVLSDRLDES
ncbi:2-C-methyl-D-erythritol 4-phosphate cytidylyltransferase [Oscillatoria sp. CS-180]|uniref:2-C-methyl-D-erythritol 4-phosphate cytidylyltransferase n=1 Tax=Oscillatoria sp. CS-180 TaxID=3021720 RepID=UPI00232F2E9A|nr:2-C-methyl-D-erythritol 4-phosphate cytidylyltransferase [Oscillatoria sp. CS-180]MDB9528278.1 2-C-methyl-D-erythritol 4-phosphate cytidylyltransferase [Oscillatoria sp. CS-180]